jgi:hypothetical protein
MQSTLDDSCVPTASERKSARRYVYELLAAAALYTALLLTSLMTVSHVGGALKFADALMPALGIAAMTAAMVRLGLRMDELQRQTMTNAAAFAAVVTVVVTPALGFLENAGVPRVSMVWVFAIAVLSWGAALPYFRRHYS